MNLKLDTPFLEIYENYMLSKNNSKKQNPSIHWDVFQEDFEKIIIQKEPWEKLLRNALSIGFNDNLRNYGVARWFDNKFPDGWKLRRDNNFKELIEENISNKEVNDKNLKLLNALFAYCGINFVINNLQPNICSPTKTNFQINFASYEEYANKKFFCNIHDLTEIYYFFVINNKLNTVFNSNNATLLEIGGGYGGLVSKIKKSYNRIRCIMIDLPETLAVQSYYLRKIFPNAKFLYLKDLNQYNEKIFDLNFDFLMLPYWEIERIPSKSINVITNVRSMMEMTKDTLNFYFHNIARIIDDNKGFFACINRYEKKGIKLEEYPFDSFWDIVFSEQSAIQRHIHQLILKRSKTKNSKSIPEILKKLNFIK